MKNTANLSCISAICSAGVLIASIFMMQAQAASLQVAPILLEFSPKEKVKELWLTNTGSESIRAQVRVNEWTQVNNVDVLTPSKSLIASPVVLSIPAQQRQLVRLIRSNAVPNKSEEAFRLIVDELPNVTTESQNGLQVLLKYSIPVFFKVPNLANEDKEIGSLDDVRFIYSPKKLTVVNQSTDYKRFSQFAYINAQGQRINIQQGLVGYVLSGQTMEWPIPNTVKIMPGGKFVVVVNSESNEQELPISSE